MTTNEPPIEPGTPEVPDTAGAIPPPPPPPVYGQDPSAPPPAPPVPPSFGNAGDAYSAPAAVSFGWNKFKANPGPWVLAVVIVFVIVGALSAITYPITSSNADDLGSSFAPSFNPVSILVNLLVSAVSYIISAVLTRGALNETEGKPFTLGNVMEGVDVAQAVILGFLLSIGTTIGVLLCFVPGILFAFFTMFALAFLVDQKMGAVDAIKASFSLVKDRIGDSLITLVLLFAVAFVGALACCVGLLVAYPVVMIAMAYAYKKFTNQPVA